MSELEPPQIAYQLIAPGVMLMFGLPELISIVRSKSTPSATDLARRRDAAAGFPALRTKVVLEILMLLFSCASFFAALGGRGDDSTVVTGCNCIALVIAITLQLRSHGVLPQSSSPLLFYFLLSASSSLVDIFLSDEASFSNIANFILPSTIFAIELLGPSGWSRRERVPLSAMGMEESPRATANIFSQLLFLWLTPLMELGSRKILKAEDLWKLPPDLEVSNTDARLRAGWAAQLNAGKVPTIIGALARAFWAPWTEAVVFKMIQTLLAFTQPQLLRRLLFWVSSCTAGDPNSSNGYTIALEMFAVAVVHALCLHRSSTLTFETGNKVTSSVTAMIYRKSLRLSSDARSRWSSGDVLNLVSIDATVLDSLTHLTVLLPNVMEVVLAFVSLYFLLGWSMLPGITVMLLATPFATAVSQLQSAARAKQLEAKDARTRFMNEILINIKTIKLWAWESAFADRLLSLRNDHELQYLRQRGIFIAASNGLAALTPFFVNFASFASFALFSGKPLTPDVAFPSLAIFTLMQTPIAVLPYLVSLMIDSRVSAKRIDDFLRAPELEEDLDRRTAGAQDLAVEIRDGEFSWSKSASSPTLTGINLEIKVGELCAILGRVGSGKSSLLSAILGEMNRVDGTVRLGGGTVAYASQAPFLVEGSIRSNITFGRAFDSRWYDLVIEACALFPDLRMLPAGDATLVGVKGVQLSGGQQARVSLARAVYSKADYYLLDDPLSAVDAHVGRHIFEKVIGPSGLLASTTRLWVTNAVQFCDRVSGVVLLRRGTILQTGTYAQVASDQPSELSALLRSEAPSAKPPADGLGASPARTQDAPLSTSEHILSVSDASEEGKLKRSVFTEYLAAGSISGLSSFLAAAVTRQFLAVAVSLWLKTWAERNLDSPGETGSVHPGYYLSVYFFLGLLAACSEALSTFVATCVWGLRAAKRMHDAAFASVLHSPMRFFDTIPSGAIQSRFSQDVATLDEKLPVAMAGAFGTVGAVLAVIAVITWSTPAFILAVVPLAYIYSRVQSFFMASSRELKRLHSSARSPVLNHLQETITGGPTIRAYRQTERFIGQALEALSSYHRAGFLATVANSWLAIRLELLSAVLIFCAAGLAVFSVIHFHSLDTAQVGLMISYALSSTRLLTWILHEASNVETDAISVERIQQFIRLPREGSCAAKSPPRGWPSNGCISFRDVSAGYSSDGPSVLNNITFDIGAREKIGVALYRALSHQTGSILIDGVETASVALEQLRSSMSLIPQDPQCFQESVRFNIDPTGTAPDEDLWRVLLQAGLQGHIQALDGQLDALLEEGGANLSAGQRQLICLARALRRHSRILIIDEGTSSIDTKSDRMVQDVLRTSFAECTVVTIAHRIETIMACDKILVMADGRVAEFATPTELLRNKTSLFYSLVKESGLSTDR